MFFGRSVAIVRPVLLLSSASAAAATYYTFFCRVDSLPLSPSHFIPTTLIESVDVSPDTKLLTLALPPELLPHDPTVFAPISSILIKDSDIQVERPYTPLEGIGKNGCLKLWVKKYQRGEVSRWLHSRQVGDSIEIRGPVKTWPSLWQTGHWDQVVLISGGTGITPFYQLLHNVFESQGTILDTHFTLLHGSRSLADLPPPSVINPLLALSEKYPHKFQLHLFSESEKDTSGNHHSSIQFGRIGKPAVQDVLRPTRSAPWWHRLFGLSTLTPLAPERKVLVLVCGPEGMVNTIAGPYGPNYSQGKVGGILGELGLQSHQVWKF